MLHRRPRAGDVVAWSAAYKDGVCKVTAGSLVVGFATDDGICRDERGRAQFIWLFGDGELNSIVTIIEEGPDVPDPRSSQVYLHDGTPYVPKLP